MGALQCSLVHYSKNFRKFILKKTNKKFQNNSIHGLKMCMWLIRKNLEDYKSVKLLRFRSAQTVSWSGILPVLILVQAVCNSSRGRHKQKKKKKICYLKHLNLKPQNLNIAKFEDWITVIISWLLKLANPYKPSLLFMGHKKTVETQTRHCRMQHLIRVSESSNKIWI